MSVPVIWTHDAGPCVPAMGISVPHFGGALYFLDICRPGSAVGGRWEGGGQGAGSGPKRWDGVCLKWVWRRARLA